MEIPNPASKIDPILDLPYELLADANSAICREMPRVAVFNAYSAVEVFAVAVYRRLKVQSIVKSGKSMPEAEGIVDKELRKPDLMKLLLNTGMKEIAGRSLYSEDAKKYDSFLKAKKRRNEVCHEGLAISTKEAEELFKLCCEVVQWIGSVAGISINSVWIYSPWPPPSVR